MYSTPSLSLLLLLFFSLSPITTASPSHTHHSQRHERRHLNRIAPRANTDASTITIPTILIQQLQQYATTYHGWITQWMQTQPEGSAVAVSQLRVQYQAFEGWVDEWMRGVMGGSLSEGGTAVDDEGVAESSDGQPSQATSQSATQKISSASPSHRPLPPYQSPSPPSNSSSHGPSTFNARAADNVAVYWGSGNLGTAISLADMCRDNSVNIIILAFLTSFTSAGGYPTIDFSKGCTGPSEAQIAAGATGLLRCEELARAIGVCQGQGKKVLLSMGGWGSEVSFGSKGEAERVAGALWDLFGAGEGQGEEGELRPFGKVEIDGFDIDAENRKPEYYTDFVTALREKMNGVTSRTYYISAAPQCPRPDESIPKAAMEVMDFVFVQFYNNPACNLDSDGFADSFRQWSADMAAGPGGGPKVFVGAPGCPVPQCSGNAYVEPARLKQIIASVKGAENMGGIMLWDGSRAKNNDDYLSVAKAAVRA